MNIINKIGFITNGFHIIDLVPENELQTGKIIEDCIIDSINAGNFDLHCYRYKCKNRSEILEALDKIKTFMEKQKVVTSIHIEGHASKDHLCLPDHSYIEWSLILDYFREINILCKNNLFFSSGSCDSAYALRSNITINKPCPVFGLLAPEQIVEAGSTSDGFIAFYKNLICSKGDIDMALHEFCQSTNAKQYAVIFAQEIFKKGLRIVIESKYIGKGKKERLEYLLSEVQDQDESGSSVTELRNSLKERLKLEIPDIMKHYEKFMMIDLYPDLRNRFMFDIEEFVRNVIDYKLNT
ncbi:hypothetical protein [Nitrosomonas ureae]|uniref:Uncharacterized protein n=1 Tax=Nitrosomonas ureae TaxID=44577 RepID=A0A1H9E3J6_9PROT|nr:hypothetical protein [Nitrosomonas ureae]SEQ20155.1 hypothetical protein SAMN05421510_10278 [Nitrosomonas ureae]